MRSGLGHYHNAHTGYKEKNLMLWRTISPLAT